MHWTSLSWILQHNEQIFLICNASAKATVSFAVHIPGVMINSCRFVRIRKNLSSSYNQEASSVLGRAPFLSLF